jgi:tryptophan-rich sensory protein
MLIERSSASSRLASLGLFVGAVAIVAVVGSVFTRTGQGSWYAALEKPVWQPPGWSFGIVWTVLYLAMAVAAWLWWQQGIDARAVITWWGIQLILNLAWTIAFFALERPAWALTVIVLLDLAVASTIIVGWQVRRAASVLLIPYLGWIVFATLLNLSIVWQNR